MLAFFESLSESVEKRGSRPAITSQQSRLTYADLFERVQAHAGWARRLPKRVGLLFSKGCEQIVCDLALSFAGKELVPLPDFFSDMQLSQIVGAAQLSDVVADSKNIDRAKRLGVTVHAMAAETSTENMPEVDAGRIIFTSGTTGNPKGVRLGSRQVLASVSALAEASAASASDRYLSVLPSALLLEQIAGIYLPLSVGGEIYVGADVRESLSDFGAALAAVAEQTKPTATVLVPELLDEWLKALQVKRKQAPQSLRFIAVGGAPVPPSSAEAAWNQGLPVYEGYGLSECSSVVTLNRSNNRRPGTVGKPLSQVDVTIERGEIVVAGQTVMDGYLGGSPHQGVYYTGDLGYFDDEGFLVVSGRKDNVIVTSAGRNISPEWVEQVFAASVPIAHCVIVEHEGQIAALIVPRDPTLSTNHFAMHGLVNAACRALPDYARPRRFLAMSETEFRSLNLLAANARPRRSMAKKLMLDRSSALLTQSA
jgi:long-subunit acyl-CoA synthetase (AMP-forming)